LSLALTTFIGKEFNPPEDQGVFIIRMEAPIDFRLKSWSGIMETPKR
jgi:multidrug efflux pump subunit AcrB